MTTTNKNQTTGYSLENLRTDLALTVGRPSDDFSKNAHLKAELYKVKKGHYQIKLIESASTMIEIVKETDGPWRATAINTFDGRVRSNVTSPMVMTSKFRSGICHGSTLTSLLNALAIDVRKGWELIDQAPTACEIDDQSATPEHLKALTGKTYAETVETLRRRIGGKRGGTDVPLTADEARRLAGMIETLVAERDAYVENSETRNAVIADLKSEIENAPRFADQLAGTHVEISTTPNTKYSKATRLFRTVTSEDGETTVTKLAQVNLTADTDDVTATETVIARFLGRIDEGFARKVRVEAGLIY